MWALTSNFNDASWVILTFHKRLLEHHVLPLILLIQMEIWSLLIHSNIRSWLWSVEYFRSWIILLPSFILILALIYLLFIRLVLWNFIIHAKITLIDLTFKTSNLIFLLWSLLIRISKTPKVALSAIRLWLWLLLLISIWINYWWPEKRTSRLWNFKPGLIRGYSTLLYFLLIFVVCIRLVFWSIA